MLLNSGQRPMALCKNFLQEFVIKINSCQRFFSESRKQLLRKTRQSIAGQSTPSRCTANKTIIIAMKLTTIILLTACLQVSAKGYSQISLNEKNVSLQKVFKEIQRQSGYDFLYSSELMQQAGKVSINVRNVTLQQALEECLAGKPLVYSIIQKTVVIKSKAESLHVDSLVAPPPPIDVHGRVVNEKGEAMEGATVTVKGTRNATATDANGEFSLKDVDKNATLIFTGTNVETREIKLDSQTNLLVVTLKTEISLLDEAQVIAYGTTTRRFSVGSISTVDASVIEKQPVTNPLLALEGQVPGLAVNATSGVPGSQLLVQVRGQNTLADLPNGFKPYDQPLFIIDGVPFAPQNNNISQLGSLVFAQEVSGGISQEGGISPFDNINPNDIQSISILKDADATSIYGTQGSNGVVIITTKKGHPGKTTFNLSINTGFNSSIRQIKLLNTQQYLQLREDAFAADGSVPGNDPSNYYGYAPDLTIFDQNKYTNWEKVIFGKTSNNTVVHGTLSGGTRNNTFLISAGYSRSDYNFPGSGYADQTYTLHSALHHASLDDRFSIDLITDYAYNQNNAPGFGGSEEILLPPNTPDLLDPAGNLLWSYKGVNLSNDQFYAYLKQPTDLENYNLNNSLQLSYKIVRGLSISANLGYNRNTTSEHSEDPATAQSPLYAYSSAEFANNNFETINIEPQLNYNTQIGKGSLNILLGGTYKKNTNNSNTLDGYNYSNDNFLSSINGAATVYAYDHSSIYKYSAGFARLKYIYAQKYIIELTGNRDGSSNFGSGRQFGNFGSVGAGWIFSEEGEFKKALPFINYGKLSGSYGTTGSDGVQPYMYQALWHPDGNIPAFQGVAPNFPENLYNPDYSWALKKSLNLALDLGILRNHILLDATYYRDREGNQLVSYPLPIQTGFSSVVENLPATIQNKGWEFSLTSKNFEAKNFSWTTNFNISFNRNKLLAFPNLASSSYSEQYIIGQPTSVVIGYRYKDVNPTTGLFEFYNKDGKLTSDPAYGTAAQGGDEVPIANREVNYMGGLGNNLSYKNFSLYFFFQFSSQTAPTWLFHLYSLNPIGTGAYNVPAAVLNNYWKEPGDHTMLQKLTTVAYGSTTAYAMEDFAESTGAYANDTYVRLKTIALSYSLPQSFVKKLHIQGCRVYVNAQNLLTITNYKVGDPEEFSDYTSFPLQRTIVFGLNLNF